MSVNPFNYEIENVNLIGGYCISSLVTLPNGDMLFTGYKYKSYSLVNQILKLDKDSERYLYMQEKKKASFDYPGGLNLLSNGSLIVTNNGNSLIRRISPPSDKMSCNNLIILVIVKETLFLQLIIKL